MGDGAFLAFLMVSRSEACYGQNLRTLQESWAKHQSMKGRVGTHVLAHAVAAAYFGACIATPILALALRQNCRRPAFSVDGAHELALSPAGSAKRKKRGSMGH